jgi:hypothetical protein
MEVDVREAPAGPEMDAACAEAMGWRIVEIDVPLIISNMRAEPGDRLWLSPAGDMFWPSNLPCWSLYIAATRELVEAMDNGGTVYDDATEMQREFIDALIRLLGIDSHLLYWNGEDWFTFRGLWTLVSAGPLNICRAFLLAHGVTELEYEETV